MKKIFLFIVCLLIVIVSTGIFLFSDNASGAVAPPPPPPCPVPLPWVPPGPDCPDSPPWTEYRCRAGCGVTGGIESRQVYYVAKSKITDVDGDGCNERVCDGWGPSLGYIPADGGWVLKEAGTDDWKACADDGDPKTKPGFSCSGPCLDKPTNPLYYDNPNYSNIDCLLEPEKCINLNNIHLPLKLDWGSGSGLTFSWKPSIYWGKPDGPQSYVIKINDTLAGDWSKVLTSPDPEYNTQVEGACFLRSNFTHSWSVENCCSAGGTNCGTPSNWNFTTTAPEPFAPYDPDWTGPLTSGSFPLDFNMEWCESKFYDGKPSYSDYAPALSYQLMFKEVVGGVEVCHPLFKTGALCIPYILNTFGGEPPAPEFSNSIYNFFTKDTDYTVEISACKGYSGVDCKDYSQKLRFDVAGTLGKPILLSPANDWLGAVPVGFPVVLTWKGSMGTASYIYNVYDFANPFIPIASLSGTTTIPSASLDWDKFPAGKLLKSKYTWKVQPCWDMAATKCEPIWSDTFNFKTTGEAPIPVYPLTGNTTNIPVVFEWKPAMKAPIYTFQIFNVPVGAFAYQERFPTDNKITFNYPELKQGTTYAWRVNACVYVGIANPIDGSSTCGDWSDLQEFTTFTLSAPINPVPPVGGNLLSSETLKWDSVPFAKAYQIKMFYKTKSADEVNATCVAGTEIYPMAPAKIITSPSIYTDLSCLGEYEWQVKSCLDSNCLETSDWSGHYTFNLIQPPLPQGGSGIIPCGRMTDDPKTPFNERDHCQIKHLFIILSSLLDILLWQLGLLVLLILVIITGIDFYFLAGARITIINVRALWRAAGIGYLILFSAWLIVTLFLSFTGYQVQFFGHWWNIKL